MARPFVTELPTQDAWAVVRDLLDGKINDLDLALRTADDCLSFAAFMYLSNVKAAPTAVDSKFNAVSAKAAVAALAAGDPTSPNWKDIFVLILDWLRSFLAK